MPPTIVRPLRAALDILHPLQSRPVCEHIPLPAVHCRTPRLHRNVSTAGNRLSEMEVESDRSPRWSHTPPLMKAPVPSRLPRKEFTQFVCNSDPKKLDDVYVRLLGRGGDKLLSDETKWLAITAKSFDHGRRGFNDRLAFFGKRILEVQCSLGLLSMIPDAAVYTKDKHNDSYGREAFEHPATKSIEVLSGGLRHYYTHHKQLAAVATMYGIPDIVRWQPKNPDNLTASGAEVVYAQALSAILGALALEQGSAIANRIAKEKILTKLGMKVIVNEQLGQPEST